ncbi:UNVERIFIED_CONTAM: hypothetical protein Slati_1330000, partial [Sesamum latifolium]
AYQWLKQIAPKFWCKFKMSDKPKCYMLSNNLSESFNNYITREEPILSLLEKCCGCHFIRKRGSGLLNTMEHGKYCQVPTHLCHATCAILKENKSPEDFVSHYYYVSSYKLTYSFIIHPPEDVRKVEVPKEAFVMPPPFKRLPGRPKKLRKKGADEINIGGRVTKRGSTMTCSKYGGCCYRRINRHTDAGRGRGTTADAVGGRRVAAGASRGTKTAAGRGTMTIVDSAAAGRGRGRGRGRGPLSGIGNWNGIGMSTVQHFIPAPEISLFLQLSPRQNCINNEGHETQMVRRQSRLGDAMFSNQTSSNHFIVVTDHGEP